MFQFKILKIIALNIVLEVAILLKKLWEHFLKTIIYKKFNHCNKIFVSISLTAFKSTLEKGPYYSED